MSEFGPKPEEMDRRLFLKNAGATLASIAMCGVSFASYNWARNTEDHEGWASEEEGKKISGEERKEIDGIIDESLGDLEKMRDNILDMKAEMQAAGATDKQISDSVSKYAKYAGDRLEDKMIEFAEQLEETR